MKASFNPWRIFASPSNQVQLNSKTTVPFGDLTIRDTFQNNSVDRYFDEKYIKNSITQNPELKQLLNKHNIKIKLNLEELNSLRQNHCKETAEISAGIYKNLAPALKDSVNVKDLKDGAILHDIGKVLIPPEILNKNGKLTEEEYKIMRLHSEIGYQILKNSNVNNEVLALVRHHHDNLENDKKFVPDVNLQILNLADKYSALTEKRIYKDALTPQQALTIIYGEVQKGEVHPMLYNALIKTVNPVYNRPNFTLKVS